MHHNSLPPLVNTTSSTAIENVEAHVDLDVSTRVVCAGPREQSVRPTVRRRPADSHLRHD